MIFDEMEFGSYDRAERKARKAFELYEDGKMSQALDELETALEINPTNSSWHFDKALTLDAISRFNDAISEFEAALELKGISCRHTTRSWISRSGCSAQSSARSRWWSGCC